MDHGTDPQPDQPTTHWAGVNHASDSALPPDSTLNPLPTPIQVQVQSVPIADRDIFGNAAPAHHADWSHRRGEPRVFTLLWMIFLMASTVLMFSSMGSAYSISPNITRPAAQTMLTVVVIGFSILWPMVRFSQYPSHNGHVRFALRDALVIYVPMQAVIWPQTLPILAGWPIDVVAAISAMCLAWIVLIAGIVAMGSSSIERNAKHQSLRAVWMLIIITTIFAAPLYGGFTGHSAEIGVDQPRVGWMLSPVSGLLEITRDRRELGANTHLFFQHWRMILAVFCIGVALLLLARATEVARSVYRA